jgi:hypothetical protein
MSTEQTAMPEENTSESHENAICAILNSPKSYRCDGCHQQYNSVCKIRAWKDDGGPEFWCLNCLRILYEFHESHDCNTEECREFDYFEESGWQINKLITDFSEDKNIQDIIENDPMRYRWDINHRQVYKSFACALDKKKNSSL